MFEKLKKRRRIKPVETILDSDKFKVSTEETEKDGDKLQIDYVLLPSSFNGKWALWTGIAATAFLAVCLRLLYLQGQSPQLNATVWGVCGIFWSLAAVYFGGKGLTEKNRNYTTSYVGIGLGAMQLIAWIILLILTAKVQ